MGFSELLHKANGGDHAAELEANRVRSEQEEADRIQAIRDKAASDSGLLVMSAETAESAENAALHGIAETAPNGTELSVLPPAEDPGDIPPGDIA